MRILLSAAVASFFCLSPAIAQNSMFTPQVEKPEVKPADPKPKAKPIRIAAAKPHPGLNSALIESDDLDANQLSNDLFQKKTPKGCSFTGGQEINSSLTEPNLGGESGIYLLNATCGKVAKQYAFLVTPSDSGLKEVLFTAMRDNTTTRIYFQSETRRLFARKGDNLREIEWQPLAKKAVKKADLKSGLNKALFGITVPKAKAPQI